MAYKMNTKRTYFDFKKQSTISERFEISLSQDNSSKTMRISKKQKFQCFKKPLIHQDEMVNQITYEPSFNLYDNTPDDNFQYNQIGQQSEEFYTVNFCDMNEKYQISTGAQNQIEQQKEDKNSSYLFIQSYPQLEDEQW